MPDEGRVAPTALFLVKGGETVDAGEADMAEGGR